MFNFLLRVPKVSHLLNNGKSKASFLQKRLRTTARPNAREVIALPIARNSKLEPYLPPPNEIADVIHTKHTICYPEKLNAAVELLEGNAWIAGSQLSTPRNMLKPALVTPNKTYTYSQLNEKVKQACALFVSRGVQEGDRVLLQMPNRAELIISWLAIIRLGAIATSILPARFSLPEIEHIIADTKPVLCITDPNVESFDLLNDQFAEVKMLLTLLDKKFCNAEKYRANYTILEEELEKEVTPLHIDFPAAETSQGTIGSINYTSGSTGLPKGCAHVHRSYLAIADGINEEVFETTEDFIFGGQPSLAFVYGLGNLCLFPFRANATTFLNTRPFEAKAELQYINEHNINVFAGGPTHYKMLLPELEALKQQLKLENATPSVTSWICAGEVLHGQLADEWKQCSTLPLQHIWGATELLHAATNGLPALTTKSLEGCCIGKKISGYDVVPLDETTLEPVNAGEQGLMAIKGPVSCVYWNSQKHQQKTYAMNGWNVPGDVIHEDVSNGAIWCHGRADDMIIAKFAQVSAVYVENILLQHDEIFEVAVVGIRGKNMLVNVVAVVVLKDGKKITEDIKNSIIRFNKAALAKDKQVDDFVFAVSLPKTKTGKLQRKQIRIELQENINNKS